MAQTGVLLQGGQGAPDHKQQATKTALFDLRQPGGRSRQFQELFGGRKTLDMPQCDRLPAGNNLKRCSPLSNTCRRLPTF
eukprot:233097-Alexandrium_andersonii.AAC.1